MLLTLTFLAAAARSQQTTPLRSSVMDRIAKESGGAHIDAESVNPREYFQQIAEELRTSYELAYYPTNPMKDDSFRKITIKGSQEGLKFRSKTGYFAR